MLIRFTVENFLSFNEETEFNMLTGEIRRLPNHVFSFSKVEVLKSAVIYGANGAGKSNLIAAMNVLRHIIIDETTDYVPIDSYFRLDAKENKPTTFEIEFLFGKAGYAYGISFFDNVIQEEWLLKLNFGKKPDEPIYERKAKKNGKESLKMGIKYSQTAKDKLLAQVYEELLEPNKPFLTLVKEKKFKEVQDTRTWFESMLMIIRPHMHFSGLVDNFLDEKFKTFTNDLLCSLETGIKEIDVQTIDFELYFGEENTLEKDRVLKRLRSGESTSVENSINTIAMIENGRAVVKKPVTYHLAPDGKKVKFEMHEESDGTLRLIDFIPLLYLINHLPVTVIIDEIDQSIHPSLLKAFITKVQNDPDRLGQLIFTTHESNLLDLDLFRQDEIWFAEKGPKCASHFYVLSDYDVRTDLDIRKGYLSGRFGAIPFLGNLRDLKWGHYVEK
jgi:AAA15 family ATPase/GTPase